MGLDSNLANASTMRSPRKNPGQDSNEETPQHLNSGPYAYDTENLGGNGKDTTHDRILRF